MEKLMTVEEQKEKVFDQLSDPVVSMRKDNVSSVADQIVRTNQSITLSAAPGSGKTSILPPLVASMTRQLTIVVVPSKIVVASVAANYGYPYITKRGLLKGAYPNLAYVDMDTFYEFQNNGCNLKNGTRVFFDESQSLDDYGVMCRAFCEKYKGFIKCVMLNGDSGGTMVLPGNIKHVKGKKNVREAMDEHGCVLKLLSSQESVDDQSLGEDEYKLTDNIKKDGMLLRKLSKSTRFILYASASNVIGLNMPNINAVIGVQHKIIDGECVLLDKEEHIQMARRAGRMGQEAFYYTTKDVPPPCSKDHIRDNDNELYQTILNMKRNGNDEVHTDPLNSKIDSVTNENVTYRNKTHLEESIESLKKDSSGLFDYFTPSVKFITTEEVLEKLAVEQIRDFSIVTAGLRPFSPEELATLPLLVIRSNKRGMYNVSEHIASKEKVGDHLLSTINECIECARLCVKRNDPYDVYQTGYTNGYYAKYLKLWMTLYGMSSNFFHDSMINDVYGNQYSDYCIGSNGPMSDELKRYLQNNYTFNRFITKHNERVLMIEGNTNEVKRLSVHPHNA